MASARSATPAPRDRVGDDSPTERDEHQSDISGTSSRRSRRARPKRWRGGPTPPVPQFDGDTKRDPQCLAKWERSLEIWLRRVVEFIPKNEQALAVSECFTGRAARKIRNMKPEEFDRDDGVDILRARMECFREESITEVGADVVKYETASRYDSESILEFIERLEELEERLLSHNMPKYPDVSRSVKLLRGCRLPESAFANLIGSIGNKFDYVKLKHAICTQFPSGNMIGTVLGGKKTEPSRFQKKSFGARKVVRSYVAEDGTTVLRKPMKVPILMTSRNNHVSRVMIAYQCFLVS